MPEPIIVAIPYKDTEKQVAIEFEAAGYTHRFKVIIDEIPVFFEPDEERQYRAVIPPEHAAAGASLDVVLLQSIAEVLAEALS